MLTKLSVRVAAMEAVLDNGLSHRLVASLYPGASRGSMDAWLAQHRSGEAPLDRLRDSLTEEGLLELTELRGRRTELSYKSLREKRQKRIKEPAVHEITLTGTVDVLRGASGDNIELTSSLIINDDSGCAVRDTVFLIPSVWAKRLHIDDQLTVKITIKERVEDHEESAVQGKDSERSPL